MAGKTFPAFPAHAQPTILSIWQKAPVFTHSSVLFFWHWGNHPNDSKTTMKNTGKIERYLPRYDRTHYSANRMCIILGLYYTSLFRKRIASFDNDVNYVHGVTNRAHGVTNHRQSHYLLKLRPETNTKVRITSPLWGKFAGDQWIPRRKGQ